MPRPHDHPDHTAARAPPTVLAVAAAVAVAGDAIATSTGAVIGAATVTAAIAVTVAAVVAATTAIAAAALQVAAEVEAAHDTGTAVTRRSGALVTTALRPRPAAATATMANRQAHRLQAPTPLVLASRCLCPRAAQTRTTRRRLLGLHSDPRRERPRAPLVRPRPRGLML